MNKKKNFVIASFALVAITALGVALGVNGKSISINASDEYYFAINKGKNDYSCLSTNENNALTEHGNQIEMDYAGLSDKTAYAFSMAKDGYIVNVDALHGINAIWATFDGELLMDFGYDGMDDYVRTNLTLTNGKDFELGNERPDYIRFHTTTGCDVKNILLSYSCNSDKPNGYNDHYVVGEGGFVTSPWSEAGGVKMTLNTENKDTYAIEYSATINFSKNDQFKIKSGDNWYGYNSFQTGEGTAFYEGQLSGSNDSNITVNGDYELTIYYKVNRQDGWIAAGEEKPTSTPIPAGTRLYFDFRNNETASWMYMSSSYNRPKFAMILSNDDFDPTLAYTYRVVEMSGVGAEKLFTGMTAGGPWTYVMFARYLAGNSVDVGTYSQYTAKYTWDGQSNCFILDANAGAFDATGVWGTYTA